MDFPQSKEDELVMVKNSDTSPLIDYISIYIDRVLQRYDMSVQLKEYLKKVLTDNIFLAKENYLKNNSDKKDYKFSTYFSWYINEALKDRKDIKEKEPSE